MRVATLILFPLLIITELPYPSTAAAASPLHAVVLLIDDLGYGDTGYMGAEYPTPAIDALALGGIRLNQSYAMQVSRVHHDHSDVVPGACVEQLSEDVGSGSGT
jgi:hypothetical protein